MPALDMAEMEGVTLASPDKLSGLLLARFGSASPSDLRPLLPQKRTSGNLTSVIGGETDVVSGCRYFQC